MSNTNNTDILLYQADNKVPAFEPGTCVILKKYYYDLDRKDRKHLKQWFKNLI